MDFPQTPPGDGRSPWRFYPHAVVAALAFVVMVNLAMVWSALVTFPGEAAHNGYDESNAYPALLRRAEAQRALGWRVTLAPEGGRGLRLSLEGRDGRPPGGMRIIALARRPVGPEEATPLHFAPGGDGVYHAAEPLPGAGQWDVLLTLRSAEGGEMSVMRRIVAP